MNSTLRRTMQRCAILCFFSTLAWAQAPAPATTPASTDNTVDLLYILRAKGILTQQEYDALKQRATVAAPPAAPQVQQAAAPPEQAQKQEAAAPAAAGAKTGGPYVKVLDRGIGMRVGEFNIVFSGEFNAFYVHDRPSSAIDNPGLGELASSGTVPNSSIRNGLLPNNFTINVSTVQRGLDIGATFGFYPGLSSLQQTTGGVNLSAGQATGFGVSGIDFRQQFVTIGNRRIGTFKMGRDIGLFGQEAVLNDMTILAVGTPNGNVAPGSVSLGRIGVGYIYPDFISQISYMTPESHGLQAGFGLFTPFSDAFAGYYDANLTGHGQPMLQAKVTYTPPISGPIKAKFFLNGITQSLEANLAGTSSSASSLVTINPGDNVRAAGIDGGAKVTIGPATLFAYGYNGRGIGQEGLFFFATDLTGHPRESRGGYFQANYTLAKRFTLGFSYGLSHLSLTNYDKTHYSLSTPSVPLTDLLKTNSSEVAQIRYSLVKWVTPIAEYTHTKSTSHNPALKAWTEDSIATGAIVFF